MANVVVEATGAAITSSNSSALTTDASGPFGYLSEAAATNLCLQSQTFGTTWVTQQLTVTADQIAAPDGTTTADKFTADGTVAAHDVYQTGVIVSNTFQMHSAYVKPGTCSYFAINLQDAAGSYATQTFDCSGAGAVAESFVAGSGAISAGTAFAAALPNGWYRIGVVAKVTGGPLYLLLGHALAATGNTLNAGGMVNNAAANLTSYWWGAQVETGSVATSYIPTTTAAVTRNADALSYVASGNIVDATGTVYLQSTQQWTAYNSLEYDFFGSTGNAPALYIKPSSGKLSLYDGTTESNDSTFTASAVAQAVAAVWGASTMTTFVGGVAGTGAAYDGAMAAGANIFVGCSNGSIYQTKGTIRNLKVYGTKLTNAQVAAL
jgi:hypothetical protein